MGKSRLLLLTKATCRLVALVTNIQATSAGNNYSASFTVVIEPPPPK
jgi:hypothetical protein